MLFDETYCFVIVVHNVCKFSIQLENRAKLKMTEPATKKFKAAEDDGCANLFDGFEVKRVLSNDVKSKKVHILGLLIFQTLFLLTLLLHHCSN